MARLQIGPLVPVVPHAGRPSSEMVPDSSHATQKPTSPSQWGALAGQIVVPVHGVTQWLELHTSPVAQSGAVKQPMQRWVVESQRASPRPSARHCASAVQATHCPEPGSQWSVDSGQSLSPVHRVEVVSVNSTRPR